MIVEVLPSEAIFFVGDWERSEEAGGAFPGFGVALFGGPDEAGRGREGSERDEGGGRVGEAPGVEEGLGGFVDILCGERVAAHVWIFVEDGWD